MYKLYDGNRDLDLNTNDLLTFVTGARMVFIEYVNYCMDNNENDLDALVYWSQALSKVLKIESFNQVKEFACEFDFTVQIETL